MFNLTVKPVEHVKVLTHSLGICLDLILIKGLVLQSLFHVFQVSVHRGLVLFYVLNCGLKRVRVVLSRNVCFMYFFNKLCSLDIIVFQLLVNEGILSRYLFLEFGGFLCGIVQ